MVPVFPARPDALCALLVADEGRYLEKEEEITKLKLLTIFELAAKPEGELRALYRQALCGGAWQTAQ